MLTRKQELISWIKTLVDTVGIKSADLEDKLLSESFVAFRTA